MLETAAQILEPAPNRNAAEWADDNRILPPGSAMPGPWQSSIVPYVNEVCEAASDYRNKYVVLCTSSQNAKTETALNIVGHRLTDGPFMPAMIVEPTEKLVRSMSKDRFTKMIDSTPVLAERQAIGQADKVVEKFFNGIRLGFAWAGSATELASHPVGLIVMDEIDRMPADVQGEGDPVTIASARTTTFWNATIFLCSSPTVEGASPIWTWFLAGSMLCWSWPCPNCDEFFLPRLRALKWPKGVTPEEAVTSAYVECPHCKHHIGDEHRLPMNEGGKFIPHKVDKSGDLVPTDTPKETNIASFWVSGIASPFVSFGERAQEWLRAYYSHDQAKIQAVTNTAFGEPYVVDGAKKEVSVVENLISVYSPKTVNPDCQLITAGIDVQQDGFYYTVRGWGYLSQSWLIDYGHIVGDTALDSVWLILSQLINEEYGGRKVKRFLIDAGYRPGDKWRVDQHLVKKFVMKHLGRVSAVFGRANLMNESIIRSEMKLDIKGQKVPTGVPQFVIDTDHFKQWLHSRYDYPLDQVGSFLLHNQVSEAYLRSLVSEQLIIKATGVRSWAPRQGYENHWFDCEVYARVAAVVENVAQLKQIAPPKKKKPKPSNESNGYNEPADYMAGYS